MIYFKLFDLIVLSHEIEVEFSKLKTDSEKPV